MSDRLVAAITELVAALRVEIAASDAPAPDRLVSVNEAMTILGISRPTIYGELGSGRLGSLKVRRRRLIPLSAIQTYIVDRETR